MVIRWLSFYLLCVFSTPVLCVSLDIVGVPDSVEYGKSISVDIRYEGGRPSGEFDLQQWQDDFFIDYRGKERKAIEDGRVRIVQHLRLYPRGTGSLVLERIAFGGTVAGPIRIQSQPPLRKNIDASPKMHPLPQTLWQGQTVTLTADVPLLHPSNVVKVEEPDFPGFKFLGIEKIKQEQSEFIRLKWQLVAEQSGIQYLAPPAIEQRGRGRWRFYLPFASLKVRPLPSYLLPGIPVGEPVVQSSVKKIGDEKWWSLTLQSTGELPADVQGVRSYMATLAGAKPGDVERVSRTGGKGGSHQEYRVKVPDWSFGQAKSAMNFRYFDIDSGRMQELPVNFPLAWNLPKGFLWPFYLLMAAIAFALFLAVRSAVRVFRDAQSFKQALENSPDADSLRKNLLSTGPFVSLEAWADSFESKKAKKLAEAINKLSFSPAPNRSFESVKRDVLRWYNPLRIWSHARLLKKALGSV